MTPHAPLDKSTSVGSASNGGVVPPPRPVAVSREELAKSEGQKRFETLKSEIHRKLIDRVDLFQMLQVNPEAAKGQIRDSIEALLFEARAVLNQTERQRLIKEIEDDIFGLGPLEPLVHDPTINDILVNRASQVYVERSGKLELTPIKFRDDEHVLHVIDRIVSRIGRRVDESSPMVDARLPDGSRVNAVIPPLALDGPILSIRKFKKEAMTVQDLVRMGSVSTEIAPVLEKVVRGRLSLLISGGTGAGKTTLLNALSAFIPPTERVITIEDAAELRMQQPHVLRLETRPPNIEGKGEITQRDLVRNALRMRPDRIIIGEVRGPEALDMLQAMNTGHEGSITTIHANAPRDALSRLETMILMSGTNLTQRAMRQQVSSAIDLVIQIQRFSDGVRRIVSLSEIVGMEGEVVTMQEIYMFKQRGLGPDGKVLGEFMFTGVRPAFSERLESMGLGLDAVFAPRPS